MHRGPLELVSADPLACARCGSFAQLRYSWAQTLCDECLARRHPALDSGLGAGTLIRESLRLLQALGPLSVPIALAPAPLVFALRLIWPAPDSGNDRADTIADLGPTAATDAITGLATAVLTVALLQILLGDGRPSYAAALRVVGARVLAIAGLFAALAVAGDLLYLVLRFLAYTLVWLSSALALPVLLHERVGPFTGFARSMQRSDRQKSRSTSATRRVRPEAS